MDNSKTKTNLSRVYICHTYYHVYMSVVKELALKHTSEASPDAKAGADDALAMNKKPEADIILSTMSNDFESLPDRLRASGIFGQVFIYDEQSDVTSPEVMSHHKDYGNIIFNMFHRIIYTRLLGRLQEAYIPTDLRAYGDVYVFCDSDPIGYYLNYKKIHYHAIEDGLNSGLLDDQAYLSNKSAFRLKKLLARLGLIFIECGYSRYCLDYEVNDISANHSVPPNVIEVPHTSLLERLKESDHTQIAKIFIKDWDNLKKKLIYASDTNDREVKPIAMILTEPLCTPDIRQRMFSDIVDTYSKEYYPVIKPHPRDELDYRGLFPGVCVIEDRFPMEVLNDMPDFHIAKLVSVITQINDIKFADSIDYLGLDFLDRYEDPAVHRRLDTLI